MEVDNFHVYPLHFAYITFRQDDSKDSKSVFELPALHARRVSTIPIL